MPIFPHLFSFRDAEIRDYLRRRREKDWHRVVESIVIEDGPTRVAAHDLRPDRINNASDSGFTNGERAHRTGLDSRIERATSEPPASRDILHVGECDEFRVTADVTVANDGIVAFCEDSAVLADEGCEGEFPFGRFLREFYAA